MRITDKKYFSLFEQALDFDLETKFSTINNETENIDLAKVIKSAAIFSLNVKGSNLDWKSFHDERIFNPKLKMTKEVFDTLQDIKEVKKLVTGYEFAMKHNISEVNILKVHELITENILPKEWVGSYRTKNARTNFKDGDRLYMYTAVSHYKVAEKMEELIRDIKSLEKKKLSIAEVFYHASLIHLHFLLIKPFREGNGLVARLLEKWFLFSKFNDIVWLISSEYYYKENRTVYHNNTYLGVIYYYLNYDKCVPFLTMLASSLK